MIRAEPLESEITVGYTRATPTMPGVHWIKYRDVTIWERLSPPNELDIKAALESHHARQAGVQLRPVKPFNRAKGRPRKDAPRREEEGDE